jgi:hypothetical protein
MAIGIYRNMSNIIEINKLIGLFLGTFEKESHVDILIQNTKKDHYLYISRDTQTNLEIFGAI